MNQRTMVRNIIQGVFLLLFIIQNGYAQTGITVSRNDHIFPPARAAKPFIDYDKKGFIINGKRTFVVSAGIEYARVPRGLWHDRLLKLKRGGFNAVEVYTFWNYHEPREGEFDFSGDRDLNAFLKLVKEMGMYAIVRVGPYYCGEWTLGGFPIWLKFKPGLRVRENDPLFLTAAGNFFDKLIPIVAGNQIHHGGSVIMVQLENEHRAGWGTIVPDDYFRFLINKTVSLGLQVPYFFSGLHPGNDPAGNLKSLDDPQRPNPWFSTEYWGVWFSNYGPQPQDSTIYDRRTWKIIARGGNGYNVYMAHGGSNFDYNNDRDMAASYDYGAAIGQGGDLRPIYYGFKRAGWFARSFQDILANSTDNTGSNDISSATDTSLVITARYSPSGTITFLDNPATKPVEIKVNAPVNLHLPASDLISLAPGEIMPVVQNYALNSLINLVWAPTRIYGIVTQGSTTTLVIYGASGSPARLYFKIAGEAEVLQDKQNFRVLSSGMLEFSSLIPASKPLEYTFKAGDHRIRILTVNNQLAQRTWFVDADDENSIVIGPAFAGDAKIKRSRFRLVTERAYKDSSDFPVWIFRESENPVQLMKHNKSENKPIKGIQLHSWQIRNASEAILPEYNDSRWTLSDEPLQMGADGDISANAWYRARLTVPETGKYTMQFKNIRERASVFLDGKWVSNAGTLKKAVEVDLEGGKVHHLAVFVSHDGRNKQIFYVGRLDTVDAKGITGPVTLKKSDGTGSVTPITTWRMKGGPGEPDAKGGWHRSVMPERNGPQFFKTKFTVPDLKGTRPVWRVNTTSLSHGSVWVNGHNLGRYPEKIKINGLYIPENWLKKGSNSLVIYDESGVYPEKVAVESELAAGRNLTIYTENDRLK